MKKVTLLLTGMSLVVLACASVVLALEPTSSPTYEQATAPEQTPAGNVIPGHYIVVLEDGVDNPSQVASGIEQRRGDLEVGFVYNNVLEGFSAKIPDEDLAAVRANPKVDYVEPDRTVQTVDQRMPWGIKRIDANISSTRAGDGSGAISNVNAYIIDTGIDKNHPDLNVVGHVNFTKRKNTDCNGHGTHVAGIVAAKDNNKGVVGAAPGAPLTGVKVIRCNGEGSTSKVIGGIEWVTENATTPAIANLSLSAKASDAFDAAVRNSTNSGVFYSVAAGNYGKNACKYSPARAGAGTNNGIATVAATNKDDKEVRFSNYGSCVDIWAPGTDILSTEMGGDTSKMSGTSASAPHVGGGGALYLSSHASASSSTTEGALKSAATRPGTTSKDGRQILLENVRGF